MRNWLEVNLNTLAHNLDVVRDVLPEDCEIIAVVKANAYGHGEGKVARELEALGVSTFAVASLGEALNLREAGIDSEILVLSYVDIEDAFESYANNITLCAISMDYAKALSEKAQALGIKAKVHVKLNTGMNRVGLDVKTEEELQMLASVFDLPGLEVCGIFSHFSSADDLSNGAEEYTSKQLKLFNNALDYLKAKGIDYGMAHISNSGGIGKYKNARFNAVRCGALLYGYNTAEDAKLSVKPIGTWKSVVSLVRTLDEGDCVSYSRHFKAKGGEKIATLCVGYADGYKRALSGNEEGPHGWVLLGGKRCPIIGNICMDQLMVDVSGADVKAGDIAILMGEELSADELAKYAGTCMHDIISSIGPRVERVYL